MEQRHKHKAKHQQNYQIAIKQLRELKTKLEVNKPFDDEIKQKHVHNAMNGMSPPTKKPKLSTRKHEGGDEGKEGEEDDDLWTAEIDYDMQTALHALRTKHPLIYDQRHNFIHDQLQDAASTSVKAEKAVHRGSSSSSYPWVQQLHDNQEDDFLQKFFSQQLWKCTDKRKLSRIEVHRNYKGTQHNLDDVDLSDDDRQLDEQNDFEREWQQQNATVFEQEINEQLRRQQHNQTQTQTPTETQTESETETQHTSTNNNLDASVLAFLEESD